MSSFRELAIRYRFVLVVGGEFELLAHDDRFYWADLGTSRTIYTKPEPYPRLFFLVVGYRFSWTSLRAKPTAYALFSVDQGLSTEPLRQLNSNARVLHRRGFAQQVFEDIRLEARHFTTPL